MKKIYFAALFAVGSLAFAQQGKVGVNTEAPKATLDIQPSTSNAAANATTNEGVLIPRLVKSRVAGIAPANRVEGTLVYVTDEVLAADNATFTGTGKGFYYYDAATSRWVKMGGGATTAEGTFTRNIRIDPATTVNILPTDYFVHLTGENGTINLPSANTSKGRVLCFFAQNGVMNTGALGNAGNVQPGFGACIISDGTQWITQSSY